ncbi:MAG: Disulfide bond formation protein [Pseudomonadota bacterium]|jgi:disulfide bond formation protein DsbB
MKNIFMDHLKLISGIISILLVILSVIIQEIFNLEPCPLCITQRVIFLTSGITFFIFYFKPINKIIELSILGMINLIGLIFAIRHVLIQRKVINIPAECGIDLEYMFDNFPLREVFELIFRGTGDCSEIDWSFLGITIPEWSAIWFLILMAMTYTNYKRNTQ